MIGLSLAANVAPIKVKTNEREAISRIVSNIGTCINPAETPTANSSMLMLTAADDDAGNGHNGFGRREYERDFHLIPGFFF